MRTVILITLLTTLLYTCTNEQEPTASNAATQDITAALLGTWEAKSLKIEVDTYMGQDSSFVFEVAEENWERVYSVRPFRTFFATDSTFRTIRRSYTGQVIGEDRGLWRAFGDTLILLQSDYTVQYKVLIDKGQAEWAGVIDWDRDGVEDDVYYASYRYVGRTPNE